MKPLSGDGFQRFKVTKRVVAGKFKYSFCQWHKLYSGERLYAICLQFKCRLESEVVFAGYGFNINTDSLKWNDYNGIDVKGKWVMILRGDPEPENMKSPFIPFSADRDKALLAKDMGAAEYCMVSGPVFDPQDAFEPLNTEGYSVDIPVFRIKKELADVILSKSEKYNCIS